MSPKLKSALYPLLAALLGALSTYFATGCSEAPALPPEVPQALDAAKCVERALKGVDPEALTLKEALEFAAKVQACLPAQSKPVGDAGAN